MPGSDESRGEDCKNKKEKKEKKLLSKKFFYRSKKGKKDNKEKKSKEEEDDSSLSDTGPECLKSTSKQLKKMTSLLEDTGFKLKQIERMRLRFNKLDRGKKGYLIEDDFMEIPGLDINPVADRIVHLFTNEGVCYFDTFVRRLAIFLAWHIRPTTENKKPLNTDIAKIKTLFRMYDSSSDKKIDVSELDKMLHLMMGATISPNTIAAIAYRTMVDTDTTNTNLISFKDFKKVLRPHDVGKRMTFGFK